MASFSGSFLATSLSPKQNGSERGQAVDCGFVMQQEVHRRRAGAEKRSTQVFSVIDRYGTPRAARSFLPHQARVVPPLGALFDRGVVAGPRCSTLPARSSHGKSLALATPFAVSDTARRPLPPSPLLRRFRCAHAGRGRNPSARHSRSLEAPSPFLATWRARFAPDGGGRWAHSCASRFKFGSPPPPALSSFFWVSCLTKGRTV